MLGAEVGGGGSGVLKGGDDLSDTDWRSSAKVGVVDALSNDT